MGGFTLSNDQQSPTLLPSELDEHIHHIVIDTEEIKDKSKGDVLSKALVIVQTGWFVLQCIGRGVQHLAITELEVVTLAFAALNLGTYWFWWDKPLNVQCPFPVHRTQTSDRIEGAESGEKSEAGPWRAMVNCAHRLQLKFKKKVDVVVICVRRDLRTFKEKVKKQGTWFVMWRGLLYVVFKPIIPFIAMAYGVAPRPGKKYPPFYSGKLTQEEDRNDGLLTAFIATIFGGIHCIVWSSQFPSPGEKYLWRASALFLTLSPGLVLLSTLHVRGEGIGHVDMADWVAKHMDGEHASKPLSRRVKMVLLILVTHVLLYILARGAILFLAFTSLRSLPPSAYRAVHWTTFLPHI